MLFRITTPETRNIRPKSLFSELNKYERVLVSWLLILLAIALAMPVLSRTLIEVSYIGRASDRWATIVFNTVLFGWPSLALVYFAWKVRRPAKYRSERSDTPSPG